MKYIDWYLGLTAAVLLFQTMVMFILATMSTVVIYLFYTVISALDNAAGTF